MKMGVLQGKEESLQVKEAVHAGAVGPLRKETVLLKMGMLQGKEESLQVKEADEENWIHFQVGKTWSTHGYFASARTCIIVVHIEMNVGQYRKHKLRSKRHVH